MKNKLFLILGIVLMIGLVNAADFAFQNTSNVNVVTIFGQNGNISALGNISAGAYFLGDGRYLTNLNSSVINQSIVNYWTKSGTDLYYNSGNVGIGSASPPAWANLHINGSGAESVIALSNTASGDSLIYIDASNGDFAGGDYSYLGQKNDLSFEIANIPAYPINFKTAGYNRMTITGAGLVGIGTTAPTRKLTVVNNSANSAVSQLAVSNLDAAAGGGAIIDYELDDGWYPTSLAATRDGAGYSTFDIQTYSTTDSVKASRIYVDTAGNVGIGTTVPSQKLQVNGSLAFGGGTQSIVTNGNYGLTIDPQATLYLATGDSDGVTIGRTDTNIQTLVRGVFSVTNASGTQGIYQDSSGNVGVGTTTPVRKLEVSGTGGAGTFRVNDLTDNPSIELARNGGRVGTIEGGATFLGLSGDAGIGVRLYADNNPAKNLILLSTGNVGINTTTPQNKLNVIGDINATTNVSTPMLCLGSDCQSSWPSVSGEGGWNDTGTQVQLVTASDNVSAGTFFVDNTNGRVGVGTSSPEAKLDVNGSIYANGAVKIFNGASERGRLSYDGDNGVLWLYNAGVLKTAIQSSGDSYFNGGNVGIGTTTPQNKLNIVGDINATTNIYGNTIYEAGTSLVSKYYGINNPFSFYNSTTLSSAETDPKAYNGTLRLTSNHTFNGNVVVTNNFTVDTSDFFVNANTGNVGIGTTSPTDNLDVYDGTATNADARIRSRTTTVSSTFGSAQGTNRYFSYAEGLEIMTHTNSPIGFGTYVTGGSATPKMVILSNGNVGIGTTSPGAKLDVQGDIWANATTSLVGSFVGSHSANSRIDIKNTYLASNPTASLGVDVSTGTGYVWLQGAAAGYLNTALNPLGGNVGIGNSTPITKLQISGGTGTLATGLSFGDGDSGFYESSDDNMYFQLGGSAVGALHSSGIVGGQIASNQGLLSVNAATASVPAHTFVNDVDTGVGRAGDNIVSLIAGGSNRVNITSTGGALAGQYDYNGGWTSNGLSIINGDIYAQTGYFYNISSLQVATLTVNGSIIPPAGFDNQFDVGSASLRWRDAYFGRNLYVNGTIYNSNGQAIGGNITGAGASGQVAFFNSGSNIKSDGNLTWDDTNKRLGIGTASPSRALDVNGVAQASGFLTGSTYLNPANLYNAGGSLDIQSNGGSVYFGRYSDDVVNFQVFDSTGNGYFRGNVGINTTTPQNTLNVIGDINATTSIYGNTIYEAGTSLANKYYGINNPFSFYNSTTLSSAETDPKWTGNSTLVPYLASANTFTNNNIFNGNLSVDTSDLFVNANTGNVGIGTTGPNALLHLGTNNLGQVSATRLILNPPYHSGGPWKFITRDDASNAWLDIGYGTGQVTIKNDGNVGIGTTSPTQKLTLAANSQVVFEQGSGQTSYIGILKDAISGVQSDTGIAFVDSGDGGSGYLQFLTHSTGVSQGVRMTIDKGGNVGIGTTSPTFKLDMVGSIRTNVNQAFGVDSDTHQIIASGATNSNQRVYMGYDTTNNYGYIQAHLRGTEAKPLVLQPSAGNVGIGTTSPGGNLHINGSSASVDVLTLQFGGSASGGNWAINPYILGVSNGGLSFNDRLNSRTPFVIADSGNVGIGTTAPSTLLNLNSTGNTTLRIGTTSHANTNKLEFYSISGAYHSIQSHADSGNLQIRAGDGGSGHEIEFYVDGTIAGAFDSENQFAVGKTTADYAIDVVGQVNAYDLLINGTSIRTSLSGTINSTAWNSTGPLVYLANTSANVGIGTTSPGDFKLNVNAGAATNGLAKFTGTGGAAFTEFSITGAGANKLYIYPYADGNTYFQHDGKVIFSGIGTTTGQMTIDTSGNVGINTTSPSTMLHVARGGTGEAFRIQNSAEGIDYGGMFFAPPGWNSDNPGWVRSVSNLGLELFTTTTAGYAGNPRISLQSNNSIKFLFSTNNSISPIDGAWVEKMRINSDGNVGIGTTAPSAPAGGNKVLSIESASPTLALSDTGTGTPIWQLMAYSQKFYLYDDTDARMLIDENGNVGINTTTPQNTLNVVGSVNITDSNIKVYTQGGAFVVEG